MNGELAGGDFLYKNVDVVAALEGILAVRAQVRMTRIGFEVVGGKAVVLKPVEGFARMLREAVDGFLERLVFAVGDDVQSSLPFGSAFCILEPQAVKRPPQRFVPVW